jgi:hypothetical protein
MNSEELARTTFVLHRDTHEQLNAISRHLGVSRSSLVRDVLTEPVAMMAKWMGSVPAEPTPEDIGRAVDAMQGDLVGFMDRAALGFSEVGGRDE